MSKFLDDFHALLDKVAQGNPGDPQTKADVAALTARLNDNDATDAEQSQAITELVTKLGSAPPAP